MASIGLGNAPAAAQQPAPAQQNEPAPAAAATTDYATARLERRLTAVRSTGPILLDGKLDEAAWQAAPVANHFIQNDPKEGEPATYDTEVRMLYDNDAIYFGVYAKDDATNEIIVSDIREDYNTAASDSFTVVLDTFHDGRNGYQFATNPAGAKWDAQMANEGRENNDDWDGIWEVSARIGETGWYAEMRIPFRTLKFTRADVQTWGVNFERRIRRLNQNSYWSPLPRVYDLPRVSMAGTVNDLRNVRPGRNVRIKPYVSSSVNSVAGRSSDGDFDAGFDVKAGVTSGLVLDFTVNTDFSQVEEDEQQINLTRFNLFFPEKRDFFLENSGIFQFGPAGGGGGGGSGATTPSVGGGTNPNFSNNFRLFHTRRIGLSDAGASVPILAGTRLTGRQGAYSIGVLNIQQRKDGVVPATNFTALRLRRDILANSDIGAILLNKETDGPHFNRTVGADANFRFGFLTLDGFIARTFSPASLTPGKGNELATRVGAVYSSRRWQLTQSISSTGRNFNDEMGFVSRRGVNYYGGNYGPWFRPRAISKWVRQIRPHMHLDIYTRHEDDSLDGRFEGYHLTVQAQDGSSGEGGWNRSNENILTPFTVSNANGIRVAPGRYDYNEFFYTWNMTAAPRFSVGSRFSIGEFFNGYRRSYSLGPQLRVNEHFNASGTLQINDITMPTGSFVAKLLTARVNYSFNAKALFNALVQYNSDTRQWTSNLRFNLIHRPLSDLFVVYNERRDEQTGKMLSRAVIAKLTYLVAF